MKEFLLKFSIQHHKELEKIKIERDKNSFHKTPINSLICEAVSDFIVKEKIKKGEMK